MVMIVCGFTQLARVDYFRKLRKRKHGLVFTVLAKKRGVLAEIHISQMICDETAETALGSFAEFLQNFIVRHFLHFAIVVQNGGKVQGASKRLAKPGRLCCKYMIDENFQPSIPSSASARDSRHSSRELIRFII
jgi:hypothetical protein